MAPAVAPASPITRSSKLCEPSHCRKPLTEAVYHHITFERSSDPQPGTLIMTQPIHAKPYLFSTILFALTTACSTNRADTTPAVALSESREGLAAEPRSSGPSPRRSGDTLVCEKSRKFSTPNGDRWLWVRILVERKAGTTTDNTIAETAVSTDSKGMEYAQKVELAGVSLDGDKDNTLRNTPGVRTAESKESPKQAHRARGYTIGPNMGPVEASCGG
jgi:hypothetical protein